MRFMTIAVLLTCFATGCSGARPPALTAPEPDSAFHGAASTSTAAAPTEALVEATVYTTLRPTNWDLHRFDEDDAPAAVNGELAPGPVELTAAHTYRLRFMHISPDDSKRVTLLHREGPVEWRHVAKDGADLPPNQGRSLPADLRIHVGETYDFLWTPDAPGDFTLRVLTVFDQGVPQFPREAPSPHTQDIPERVR
jgi:hypothetical protein